MQRPGNLEDGSVFRLDRRIAYPLAFLLAMPLVAVARSLLTQGITHRTLLSLAFMGMIVLLFLPWITMRVRVGSRGMESGMLFRRRALRWGEVEKVKGLEFRGRAIVVVEGRGTRLLITDMIGNFKHLVGFIIEHASGAVIDGQVPTLLMKEGRCRRDALILWIAVVLMAALVVLKFLWM